MSIKNFLDKCENKITLDDNKPLHIAFSVSGFGFGELMFYQEEDTIYCENECMSKDRIKQILSQMVDECVLIDEPFKNPGDIHA